MIRFDEEELKSQSDALNSNIALYEKYGAPIVKEYSEELDSKVNEVTSYLNKIRQYDLEFDIPSLQRIVIDLSSTIYFTSDRLEKLGILEDLSSIKYKDRYNEAYLNKQGEHSAGTKYTVEQLRNFAEQEAISERLLNFIYSHSAKIIKGKLDAAQELLKAVSKCLSAEITQMQVFGYSNRSTT